MARLGCLICLPIVLLIRPGFPLEPYTVQIQDSDGRVTPLAGATFRMQFRETRLSSVVLLELSSANGKITVLNADEGLVSIVMSGEDTALVPRGGVCDLEMRLGDRVIPAVFEDYVTSQIAITRSGVMAEGISLSDLSALLPLLYNDSTGQFSFISASNGQFLRYGSSGWVGGPLTSGDRAALGLGTAAVAASTDFATAAQGAKADTAVQPAALSGYQPFSVFLTAIAGLSPSTGHFLKFGTSAWESGGLIAADIPNLDASKITTGAFLDSQIPSSIARDSEVSSAIGTRQPLNSSLTTIAGLTPTTGYFLRYGSSAWDAAPLTASDIPNLDAAKIASGTFNIARIPDLSSVYQPVNAGLTAIAALSTTNYGRSFLVLADDTAGRATLNLGTIATQNANNVSISGGSVAASLTVGTTSGITPGQIWRSSNTLNYADSTGIARLLLNATDNLANLASPATARSNLKIGGEQSLTDGTTITWNCSNGLNAAVTLGGNRTLSISNAAAGDVGIVRVAQDGTGSRTLTLPSGSLVANTGAGVVTLSTGAGKKDLLSFYYDGTNYYWSIAKDFT